MQALTRKHALPTTSGSVLVFLPYFIFFFTSWGNYFHGGGPWDAMAFDALLVLGAYAAIDLFRSSQSLVSKTLVAIAGLPLIASVCLALYWAITRHYWPWIST